ncbi:CPBP family intramembrane glutamic endopeptidase [Draconibacterium halophilum]|uniref:CPBP family intramembrane metalloprotease n=1 Tax=Draconibacterium halophilum TaxID=2706887 RepID=A0A6C0R821_9BACT|nr:CPBP family intramembrane glutamic endopeptidase [Draconibacterium halophilum]QIA06350.1 CPBP family intramembrane metalloprotease [Draconibacterium halophilum]
MMAFTAFRDMKPFSQLIFAAFIVVVSILAFFVLSLVVAIPIWGFDTVLNLPAIGSDTPQNIIRLYKFIQVTQAIGFFIVPPFILGYLFHGKSKEYLYLDKSFNSQSAILVIVMMFFAAPLINLIGELNNNMSFPDWLSGMENWMRNAEENAAEITDAFLNVKTVGGLAFNIFMIALLPAVGEELLFRGVIQKIFSQMTHNHHWGIWISAILFSALHMQFFGFVPRVLLGALFGYLLVWSGSMWVPIIAHFLNNAIAVIAMYLISNNMLKPEYEEIGSTADSYYMAGISLALTLVFLLMYKRHNAGKEIPV